MCPLQSSDPLFFHQSSSVRLWWPNGHGHQPSYHLTVTGFHDGFLVLKTESKVRETALQIPGPFIFSLYYLFDLCLGLPE